MPYRDNDDAPKCDGPADGFWARLFARHWWLGVVVEYGAILFVCLTIVVFIGGLPMLAVTVYNNVEYASSCDDVCDAYDYPESAALSGNGCLCSGGGREPWRTER